MLSAIFLLTNPYISKQLYLDPGLGSFILQLLLASIFGALFMAKTLRKKIKLFFYRLIGKKDQTDPSDETGDPSDEQR
jgi:hypothetical protein